MAKLNLWMGCMKIKPPKIPKLLKASKGEDLFFTTKSPVQRKTKLPVVKFGKI